MSTVDWSALTKDQLKSWCEKLNVKGFEHKKKAELIDVCILEDLLPSITEQLDVTKMSKDELKRWCQFFRYYGGEEKITNKTTLKDMQLACMKSQVNALQSCYKNIIEISDVLGTGSFADVYKVCDKKSCDSLILKSVVKTGNPLFDSDAEKEKYIFSKYTSVDIRGLLFPIVVSSKFCESNNSSTVLMQRWDQSAEKLGHEQTDKMWKYPDTPVSFFFMEEQLMYMIAVVDSIWPIVHVDLHLGNLMYSHAFKRFVVIDFGTSSDPNMIGKVGFLSGISQFQCPPPLSPFDAKAKFQPEILRYYNLWQLELSLSGVHADNLDNPRLTLIQNGQTNMIYLFKSFGDVLIPPAARKAFEESIDCPGMKSTLDNFRQGLDLQRQRMENYLQGDLPVWEPKNMLECMLVFLNQMFNQQTCVTKEKCDFGFTSSKAVGRTAYTANKVRFHTSRYGKHSITLSFPEPKTQAQLISAAEDYLSKPLTEDYYNTVKDDIFGLAGEPWNEARKSYHCRGDILGDATFLESVALDRNNVLQLIVGS